MIMNAICHLFPQTCRDEIAAQLAKYAEVLRHTLPLLTQPRTFKDLIIETNGGVSNTKIRDVLRNAIAKGEVVNNYNTYLLVFVPETAVAEIAG